MGLPGPQAGAGPGHANPRRKNRPGQGLDGASAAKAHGTQAVRSVSLKRGLSPARISIQRLPATVPHMGVSTVLSKPALSPSLRRPPHHESILPPDHPNALRAAPLRSGPVRHRVHCLWHVARGGRPYPARAAYRRCGGPHASDPHASGQPARRAAEIRGTFFGLTVTGARLVQSARVGGGGGG
jgi:hypothetical protein